MTDPIVDLITSYHGLNAAIVDELDEPPSPLEFMRYVAKNRPFVVRNAAADWRALEKWDAEYLNQTMGLQHVNVAVTPYGNADAIVEQDDGSLLFVEPYETSEPFVQFLQNIRESARCDRRVGKVKYAQTQNDNLRSEYASLFTDVPSDIAFARIALQKRNAEAINFWLGNAQSLTALHKDNYENIYVSVRGRKHFVLLSPAEMPCVNEQMVRRARYTPSDPVKSDILIAVPNEDEEEVPVPIWDPDEPEKWTTPYSRLAKPLRVSLGEGDLLYLPAMWYHKVSQTVGDEDFACAVNYWYDMDFDGPNWTMKSFVRDVFHEEMRKRAQDISRSVKGTREG